VLEIHRCTSGLEWIYHTSCRGRSPSPPLGSDQIDRCLTGQRLASPSDSAVASRR